MKYGFIGCGNMGGALATALSKSTKDIMLADQLPQKAAELAQALGVSAGSNAEVINNCQKIFLAVKPQVLEAVVNSLKPAILNKQLIITIAAGIKIEKLEGFLGQSLPIVRLMPNTPVSVGQGLIMYTANKLVDEALLCDFVNDMRFSGTLDRLDEKFFDAGTAVSGCGPAYMYMFIEALADGGVACGLPRDKALLYAEATMQGAATLALSTNQHPGQLKDMVCSPGGSTIMGVKALEDGGFRGLAINAVVNAYEKNKDLGK